MMLSRISCRPPCFDTDWQWHKWREMWRSSRYWWEGICDDCTVEYQEMMEAEGRCCPAKKGRTPRDRVGMPVEEEA